MESLNGEQGMVASSKDKNIVTILMVLYSFLPDDPRVVKEMRILNSLGYNLKIICLGYPHQKKIDMLDGMRIERIKTLHTYNHRENLYNIVLFWILTFYKVMRYKPDIIHSHDLPTLPGVIFSKIFTKSKLIFDSHELFPENAKRIKGDLSYLVATLIERISGIFIDGLISVSNIMIEIIGNRMNIKHRVAIPNFPDEQQLKHLVPSKKPEDFIQIIYAGGIQPHRGYKELIMSIKYLDLQSLPRFHIKIIGEGPIRKDLMDLYHREQVPESIMKFYGAYPNDLYSHEISRSDIGLILFKGYFYQMLALPAKFYEYYYSNCHILCSTQFIGAFNGKVPHENISFVDVNSPKKIARELERLILQYHEMKKNKRGNLISTGDDFMWIKNKETLKVFYDEL